MNVCSQRRISLFLLWYVHFRKLQSFLPSLSDWIFRCCPIASNHKIVSKQTWDDSFSSRILVGDALLRGRCYNAITPSYDSFFFYGCGCGALSMFLMLSRSAIRKAVTNGWILCATHTLSLSPYPPSCPSSAPPAPSSSFQCQEWTACVWDHYTTLPAERCSPPTTRTTGPRAPTTTSASLGAVEGIHVDWKSGVEDL